MLRWLARLLGVAAIGVAIGVALVPFDTDVTIPIDPVFEGTSECDSPIREVLSEGVDGATFVDGPGSTPSLTPGFGCETPARRRLAVSAGGTVAGLLLLALGWSRRRRDPDDALPIQPDPVAAPRETSSGAAASLPRVGPVSAAPDDDSGADAATATEPAAAAGGDDLAEVRQHYESTREEERLAAGLGQLELIRTRQVLRRHLPPAPAAVLDVGGGTGVHADWLAESGYEVHVVDLAPRHVDHVRRTLGARGVTSTLGDARRLDAPDSSYDVVLLLGPLYHLVERADRLTALGEARRVVRPGGLVAVAAVNRFASLFDGLTRGFLFDPAFRDIVGGDLRDGRHHNDSGERSWFTTAFFHHPDELAAEVGEAGLTLEELVGVEGMAGWMPHLEAQWATLEGRRVVVEAAQGIEAEPSLLGLSAHLLAVARRPGGEPIGRPRRGRPVRRRR